ncbi:Transporter associated domain protein [compost metagenome]
MDGKLTLDRVNDLINTHLESDELDTIGGWLYTNQPTIKKGGEWMDSGIKFTVREMDRHRIRRVEILKVE